MKGYSIYQRNKIKFTRLSSALKKKKKKKNSSKYPRNSSTTKFGGVEVSSQFSMSIMTRAWVIKFVYSCGVKIKLIEPSLGYAT